MKRYALYGFYVVVIALLILAKLWHRQATTQDLMLLLAPTSHLVAWGTNISFVLQEKGFYSHDLAILIDKSCAGFNFWVLSFCTLFFSLAFHFSKLSQQMAFAGIVVLVSYFCTLIANASRIMMAIWLLPFHNHHFSLPHFNQHEAIGVLVYLTFLIAMFLVAQKIIKTKIEYYESSPSA